MNSSGPATESLREAARHWARRLEVGGLSPPRVIAPRTRSQRGVQPISPRSCDCSYSLSSKVPEAGPPPGGAAAGAVQWCPDSGWAQVPEVENAPRRDLGSRAILLRCWGKEHHFRLPTGRCSRQRYPACLQSRKHRLPQLAQQDHRLVHCAGVDRATRKVGVFGHPARPAIWVPVLTHQCRIFWSTAIHSQPSFSKHTLRLARRDLANPTGKSTLSVRTKTEGQPGRWYSTPQSSIWRV